MTCSTALLRPSSPPVQYWLFTFCEATPFLGSNGPTLVSRGIDSTFTRVPSTFTSMMLSVLGGCQTLRVS